MIHRGCGGVVRRYGIPVYLTRTDPNDPDKVTGHEELMGCIKCHKEIIGDCDIEIKEDEDGAVCDEG